MNPLFKPKLIAGNSNRPLATAIARRISMHRGETVELVKTRVERFNDAEIFVEVFENVRGEDMFIIQSTSNPANDNLMELLIMCDALRRSSAHRITAVMPYFGYARQDRRSKARTPISAKLVANLLTVAGDRAGADLDLHAAQIQGFFDLPVDNLYAARSSPSTSATTSEPRRDHRGLARRRRRRAGPRARRAHRRRPRHRRQAPRRPGEIASMTVIGDVRDRVCVIVGRHLRHRRHAREGGRAAEERGREGVHAYITHGVLSGPAVERIRTSSMKSLVITDSIEQSEAATRRGTSGSCQWRRSSRRRS